MELIKITEKEGSIKTVNARDLWKFLKSSLRFNDWIIRRINRYNFTENEDYTLLINEYRVNGNNGGGSTRRKEYHISIDMAKELSMLENNEKGKQARKYFIECEKKVKQPIQLSIKEQLANALILADKVIKEKDNIIEKMQPKVETCDTFLESENYHTMQEVGKHFPGFGRNKIFDFLRNEKVLMHNNVPYQRFIDNECFKVIQKENFKGEYVPVTLVSSKGMEFIEKYLRKEGKIL
jgi:anti-repressor protein